jgi:tetratricopeptide (TPR) repeat protein
MRINLGQFFMRLQQWEQAANFFAQAVERKPDLPAAYYNLAQAYKQNQQILEAENALQQTLLLIDQETNLEDYTAVENELTAISEQADQLRAQLEAQQGAQGNQQPLTAPEIVPDTEEAGLLDQDAELSPTEESNLSDLLDEEETSSLLREGRLIPEEETID